MLTKRAVILLAAAFAGCAGCAPAPKANAPAVKFELYKSEAGKFSVLFPGKPEEQTQEVATAIGPVKHLQMQAVVDNVALYTVIYQDYPPTVQPAQVLKITQDNLALFGTVISSEDITLGKNQIPGRSVMIEKPGLCTRIKVFFRGQSVYQVLVAAPTQDATKTKDADKFFDSFEISE